MDHSFDVFGFEAVFAVNDQTSFQVCSPSSLFNRKYFPVPLEHSVLKFNGYDISVLRVYAWRIENMHNKYDLPKVFCGSPVLWQSAVTADMTTKCCHFMFKLIIPCIGYILAEL